MPDTRSRARRREPAFSALARHDGAAAPPPKADVEAFPFGEGLVLFQPGPDRVYTLNASGRIVWEAHSRGELPPTIARFVARDFKIPPSRALRDVEHCLTEWSEAGLLAPRDGSRPGNPPDAGVSGALACGTHGERPCGRFRRYRLRLAGRSLDLACGDAGADRALHAILGHLARHDSRTAEGEIALWRSDDRYRVSRDGVPMHTAHSLDAALAWVIFELVEQVYRSRDCLAVLHAGAVGWDDAALLFAGAPGSGKSTLIAALQAQGLVYLADDVCPVEPQRGELVPVPMSQCLKSGSWPVLGPICPSLARATELTRFGRPVRYLPPLSGSPAAWDRPWPVRALVFPCYRPGGRPSVERLSPLDALSRFIESESLRGPGIRPLLAWLKRTPAFALDYGDTGQAVEAVQRLFGNTLVRVEKRSFSRGRTAPATHQDPLWNFY